MPEATFCWRNDTRQYSNGQLLFLGPWCVGSVLHNSNRPKGVEADWRATCTLPGVRAMVGDYPTVENGKRDLEQLVSMWLMKATEKKQ